MFGPLHLQTPVTGSSIIPIPSQLTFYMKICSGASILDFPSSSDVKHPPAMQETWVRSLGWEDPLEKEMATHISLPGKFHGQRSLAGCSPEGRKELDTTE